MSRHASFLLGQALEALTMVVDAPDLDTAAAIASAALAGIVPSDADWPGVERGTRSPLIGDGAATPPAAPTTTPAPTGGEMAAVSATGTPTPAAAPSPVLRALADSPMCGNPSGGYVCVRDAHPRRPLDHVYLRPQQMKGGGSSEGQRVEAHRYQPRLGLVTGEPRAGGAGASPAGPPRELSMTGGNS